MRVILSGMILVIGIRANCSGVERLIALEATKVGIPVDVALAIAWVESRYRHRAKGWEANRGMYSYGIFQLLESTADYFCGLKGEKNIIDVRNNIRCAIRYLKSKFVRYKDRNKAILAYNSGSVIYNKLGIPINLGYLKKVLNRIRRQNENINFNIMYGSNWLPDYDTSQGSKAFSRDYYNTL